MSTVFEIIACELAIELQQLCPKLIITWPGFAYVKIRNPEPYNGSTTMIIFIKLKSIMIDRHKNLPSIFIDYADPGMVDQIQRIIEEYFGAACYLLDKGL